MPSVTYTDFRKNLARFLTVVEEDCEELIVDHGKGRKVIVLSLDEFSSLRETAYLLSSPKNRKHLEESLQEVRDGKTVSIAL